jgi:hypothetical protein
MRSIPKRRWFGFTYVLTTTAARSSRGDRDASASQPPLPASLV